MMKLFFCCVIVASQFLSFCYANESDVKNVFVSILPQKYFIERIAGDRIDVSVMVGTGQSPETYEPTPKQMALLNKSSLYFQIGVPFENIWIDAIKELNPDMKIIACCEELKSIALKGHLHDEHAQEGNAPDPHVWTSPDNAKYIALIMKNALKDAFPAYHTEFEENYIKLLKDLDKLDADIKSKLAGVNNRYFIVSHPSWAYYARAYDLIQLPIELNGKEVRAKSLSQLIDFARTKNIKRVFVQKQFNNNSAEILANEIGADIVELDPLADDYISNLYFVTDAIVSAGT